MNLRTKRIIFWVVWVLIMVAGPVTVISNSNSSALTSSIGMLSIFQRMTGLVAFSLLFIQIMIGSKLTFWTQQIGAKAYRVHTTQGLAAYALMLLHPLLYFIFTYSLLSSIIGSLGVFIATSTTRDLYIGLGRIALTLGTISVVAGYFRTRPFFRRNWRFFHAINYLLFYLVAVHAYKIGTDTNSFPFIIVFWLGIVAVSTIIVMKITRKYFWK